MELVGIEPTTSLLRAMRDTNISIVASATYSIVCSITGPINSGVLSDSPVPCFQSPKFRWSMSINGDVMPTERLCLLAAYTSVMGRVASDRERQDPMGLSQSVLDSRNFDAGGSTKPLSVGTH